MEPTPLAEAKLAPPRVRTGIVARPRIDRALDGGRGAELTLVSAPPGLGKTTAVRAWCDAQPTRLAWVTLDEGDNDPVRLWTYVATAVDRIREGLGRTALQRLRVAGAPIENAVDALMNGIGTLREGVVLVLDDLHAVTDGACLASIDYALERLPATARMVVITRRDPPLGLPQRRARGGLAEVRADQLAMTAAEAHELVVVRSGLTVDANAVAVLRRRTEGWPALLTLAAIWLKRVDDPGRALREFGGGHSFVAEYLSHEVLDSLEPDLRDFLVRVAVLGRFTPQLCDAVLERTDSAALLADLEHANLLAVRLERGTWFRVHALFAEFARYQLASRQPDAARDLHRRAAIWLRERGLVVEAAEHAVAAGDHAAVADLLAEHCRTLIRTGAARTLLRLVATLPERDLVSRPDLAAAGATAAAIVGGSAARRRRLLELADRGRSERPGPPDAYVEALVDMARAVSVDVDVRQAVAAGSRAVELARTAADDILVAAHAAHARALYLAGDLAGAWSAALAAVRHPDIERRAPGNVYAQSTLALVAADRGHAGAARRHAEQARELIGRVESTRSWLGANASAAMGAVLEREGLLAEAERQLAHAEHFFRDDVETVHHTWLLARLARVRVARGHIEAAEMALQQAREGLDELDDAGIVRDLVDATEAELARASALAAEGEVLALPTEAELPVLRFMSSDLSAREIAGRLFLSVNTVRSHTRAIYRKLHVNTRVEAVARAEALGLLDPAQSPE